MRWTLRRVGKSWRLVIPNALLAEIGATAGTVDIIIRNGRIVIEAKTRKPRLGWAQASHAVADAGDDELVWPDFANTGDVSLSW
jgi:antitoxin MazE